MATDAERTGMQGAGQERREDGEPPAEPMPPVTGLRQVTPLEDAEEGGDPVCWAHLVCEECGAVTTEGHRDWCSRG
ncbi:MAG: hypothetical protein ACRDNW_09560 [Trebonia sp.]